MGICMTSCGKCIDKCYLCRHPDEHVPLKDIEDELQTVEHGGDPGIDSDVFSLTG